ncbi:hypothetical protein BKA62DRAFT_487974 [Auriculariales sp. MPI-PUGE-AT-0066]|nr:hypothetical protein BKA62DRAFT_487974 [Auriculariales sp. MPI-PUGE-AT-0066]
MHLAPALRLMCTVFAFCLHSRYSVLLLRSRRVVLVEIARVWLFSYCNAGPARRATRSFIGSSASHLWPVRFPHSDGRRGAALTFRWPWSATVSARTVCAFEMSLRKLPASSLETCDRRRASALFARTPCSCKHYTRSCT